MTCAEFLDRYTDFRDGLISAPRELRRFERHLTCCPACRRYDAAVRRRAAVGLIATRPRGATQHAPPLRRGALGDDARGGGGRPTLRAAGAGQSRGGGGGVGGGGGRGRAKGRPTRCTISTATKP